jgi:hypothetical protein
MLFQLLIVVAILAVASGFSHGSTRRGASSLKMVRKTANFSNYNNDLTK